MGKASSVHAHCVHMDGCMPVCTAVATLKPNSHHLCKVHAWFIFLLPCCSFYWGKVPLFPRTRKTQTALVAGQGCLCWHLEAAKHKEPLVLPQCKGWHSSCPRAAPVPSARASRGWPAAKVRNTLVNTTTKRYQDRLKSKKSTH